MSKLTRNGTTEAHGRTWPMYEHEAFSVEVLGNIEASSVESAEDIRTELEAVLSKYGVTVRVYPVLVLGMSPEDQAEKEELDRQALAAAGYTGLPSWGHRV